MEEDQGRHQTPGLKWRQRKSGQRVPYWIARSDAIAAGYPVKSANLGSLADNPILLSERCKRLQGEMLLWLGTGGETELRFDGTISGLLDVYERHPESTFRALAPSSRHPYSVYIARLRAMIGSRRVTAITGLDIMRWHKVWREPDKKGAPEKLAAARMALTVLKSALTFGAMCGLAGCLPLRETLRLTRLPGPQPRQHAPTAEQIVAARAAAHAIRRPSLALAYALQFETVLRQWDVVGRWVELSDPAASAVLGYGRKWIGLSWSDIDANLILRVTPHKTAKSSNAKIVVDLTLCPMVLEEMRHIADDRRAGPIILDERTALPYFGAVFRGYWKRDIRPAAGIPTAVWNRDIRAGGITEGRRSGAEIGDASKAAGHTKVQTTARVYDRDVLDATRRVQRSRLAMRVKSDDD